MATNARGRPLTSLTGFIGRIEDLSKQEGDRLFYRGHADQSYAIVPSIFRKPEGESSEDTLFRELITTNPDDFKSDDTTLERLARMQHHSCPTRLLDITANPLVALYFATNSKREVHGEVIVFTVSDDAIKFFDSDTVSCIANLARMSSNDKEQLRNMDAAAFKGSDIEARLLHFIRQEKPYFESKIMFDDLNRAVVVRPRLNNKRILAQSGAFMIYGAQKDVDDNPVRNVKIERISIDKGSKNKISKSLDAIGINEGSMYLDIDSYARYLKSARGL